MRFLTLLAFGLTVGCGSAGPLFSSSDDDGGGSSDGGMDADTGVDGGDGGEECPGVLERCGGECVDPRSSLAHCGACFNACAAGEFCAEGFCTESCPLTECGAECADLSSSPAHCGTCFNECGDTGFCRDGACVDTCPSPLTRCGEACVDTSVDPANCGVCGASCGLDMVCASGECALECPDGTTNCDGACIDTTISDDNCGGCGRACAPESVCRMSRCIPVKDLTDTDGDGIVDIDEGTEDPGGPPDTDGDGTPDFRDLDSDDDGYPDEREAGDDEPGTPPVDSDRDGTPDFRDDDSDNDGVPDADESRRGCLDPTDEDTDGDGQSDLAEITAGTDPCDPSDRIPEFFFILPKDDPSGDKAATLTFDTNIRRADVHFSVDTTGSMGGEIDNLQSSLRTRILPGIQGIIPDTAFGVSEFEDFPVNPFGNSRCRGDPDLPFKLLQQVTTDASRVGDGIRDLDMPLGCGGDLPESTFESLFQIADGGGIDFFGGSVPPFMGDPTTPGAGTIGGVGFRDDAFPIVIHVTDDVPHTQMDYTSAGIAEAHSRDDVVDALGDIRARMIGVASRTVARPPLEDLAIATEAVVPPDATGNCRTGVDGAARRPETLPDGTDVCPLVFDARSNGSGLSDTLVDAVNQLVTAIRFDTVSVRVVDDPNDFIKATIPRSADPPDGADPPTVADLDDDTIFDSFVEVTPGTIVTFSVVAYNDTVEPTDVDQVFTVTLQVIGDGVTVLDEKPVTIIVPRREEEE